MPIMTANGRKALNVTDINKALTALRRQITACGQSANSVELYKEAEKLQHMAFELKDMALNGGTWAQRRASA